MKTIIKHNTKNYTIDLSEPLDISIPITGKSTNVNAWYLDPPTIEPHTEGEFIGKVIKVFPNSFL